MALDLINEVIVIRGYDRMDVPEAPVVLGDGVQSSNVGDNFWDEFEDRVKWGGEEYNHDTSNWQKHDQVAPTTISDIVVINQVYYLLNTALILFLFYVT